MKILKLYQVYGCLRRLSNMRMSKNAQVGNEYLRYILVVLWAFWLCLRERERERAISSIRRYDSISHKHKSTWMLRTMALPMACQKKNVCHYIIIIFLFYYNFFYSVGKSQFSVSFCLVAAADQDRRMVCKCKYLFTKVNTIT